MRIELASKPLEIEDGMSVVFPDCSPRARRPPRLGRSNEEQRSLEPFVACTNPLWLSREQLAPMSYRGVVRPTIEEDSLESCSRQVTSTRRPDFIAICFHELPATTSLRTVSSSSDKDAVNAQASLLCWASEPVAGSEREMGRTLFLEIVVPMAERTNRVVTAGK